MSPAHALQEKLAADGANRLLEIALLDEFQALVRLDPRQPVALAHERLAVGEERCLKTHGSIALLGRVLMRDARPRLHERVQRGPRRVLFHPQAIAMLLEHRIRADAIAIGLRQIAMRALEALPPGKGR